MKCIQAILNMEIISDVDFRRDGDDVIVIHRMMYDGRDMSAEDRIPKDEFIAWLEERLK